MTTAQYIAMHADEDPATLALRGAPVGVDMPYALRQIEGRQTAARKLPAWAATDGIVYPVRLSMQQCSSQATAQYKAAVVRRLVPDDRRRWMADLTGGLGVDFSYVAPLFGRGTYVERDAALCDAARVNMPLLVGGGATAADDADGNGNEAQGMNTEVQGMNAEAQGMNAEVQAVNAEVRAVNTEVQVVNADSGEWLNGLMGADGEKPDFIFIDPARRDTAGHKVVRIADCQPDVVAMQDTLLACAPVVMVKLSPMLDTTEAVRQLRHVSQVHIVGADGECKELLLVLERGFEGQPLLCCGDISVRMGEQRPMPPSAPPMKWLYIPSPAMMKAGLWGELCHRYRLHALHPDTHVFTSDEENRQFPGRVLRIDDVCDVRNFARRHPEVKAAAVSVHGYPDTPDSLRKRLKIRDGMEHFVVATTLSPRDRVLLLCH